MAHCVRNVLALRAGSYQAFKESVEVEVKEFVSTGLVRRRSIRSLKGGSSIGPSSLETWVSWSSGGLTALSHQRKRVGLDGLTPFVCQAGAYGGPSELEPSSETPKPKETVNTILRLISKLMPAIAIGVACWLVRGPNIALAGVEAPNFVVGGEASQGGALSREIAKAGGGVVASAWTGLVAGGLHTLTGPDHLAALAPLCIGRSRLQSFSVGALWGCGHDAGQVIFGIIFLLLKDRLHLGVIQTWAARVVGLTLITIGGMGIKEAQEIDAAAPVLAEGEMPAEPVKKSVGPATFITGIVYGLQPDALLMILPALSLPSRAAGAAFLGMFLLGTVLAMGSYTAFVSTLSKALQKRVPKITYRLTIGSSLIAIALGIAVLLGEIFGFSLF